jgi:hypothetical protein
LYSNALTLFESWLTGWLNNSMESSPSGDTSSWVTQEFPNILRNTTVHCHLQNSPPLVPVINQNNSVNITPFYWSQIHFKIILPPTSRSSQWSLCFWFSYVNIMRVFILSPLHGQVVALRRYATSGKAVGSSPDEVV